MGTTATFIGRFGSTLVRLTAAFALALMLVGAVVHNAGAAEMDKGAFSKGCTDSGGSFVDNGDGSFQCNLKSGGTIKCPDTKSQCSYTARLIASVGIAVASASNLQVVEIATPVRPAHRANIGAASRGAFSLQAITPTPTPNS